MVKKKKKSAPRTKAKVSASRKVKVKAKKKVSGRSAPKKYSSVLMRLFGVQAVIAGSAIAVLILLGVVQGGIFATHGGNAAESLPATVMIEHDRPLSLGVLFAKKEHAGYVILENKTIGDIKASVPSTWQRVEVSGARIEDVTSDAPSLGFTRWTLPGGASIKMIVPEPPMSVFFMSDDASTAAVDVKTVDLPTQTVTSKVVLLQKQVLVPLWTQDE